MSTTRFGRFGFTAARACVLALAAALVLISACSINVKKEKNGEEKQVDINTLVGGIHVSKGVDVAETGLPVYPGAHLEENDADRNNGSANVNISGFGYGLKVVVLKYQSNDPPDKVIAYYKDQLKKYGDLLVCHTPDLDLDTDIKGTDQSSHNLTCGGASGSTIELKVGTKENQHVVAVRPEGKGSSFVLVYVRTHGKEAEI
jgi:hypothetical protein